MQPAAARRAEKKVMKAECGIKNGPGWNAAIHRYAQESRESKQSQSTHSGFSDSFNLHSRTFFVYSQKDRHDTSGYDLRSGRLIPLSTWGESHRTERLRVLRSFASS